MKRAALAAAVVLSGSRTMAEPCAPSARLDGDRELAARVEVELRRLGVATTAAPGCSSLRAAVTRDPSGAVAVTIRDPSDRIEGRVVGDEMLAAVWIDSWLHDDVAAPAWAPRDVPPLAAPGMSSASPDGEVDAPAAESSTASPDPIAVAASYETGWTDDGSGWSGLSAMACVRIGRVCAGARARAAWQPKILSADLMTGASRSDLEALAIATASARLGRMYVAPELGLGVGRFTTERLDGCAPPPGCDPTTDPSNPACKMPPADCPAMPIAFVGDGFRADTWTPRVAASVRVAVPLFDHVWLEGSASAQLAPGAHTDGFKGPIDAAGNALTIPGEPSAALSLGIGLRVGDP